MDDDYFSYDEEIYDEGSTYSSDDGRNLSYVDEDEQQAASTKSTSQVITPESLVAAQKQVLVRVMELVSVKENQARTLLVHYQWNVDKLLDVFFDDGKDGLFSRAGLTVFDPCLVYTLQSSGFCEICYEDDLSSNVMTMMECGHCFCNDCWREHFTVKINEGESNRIRCMAHKCNAICDDDVVRRLVCSELAEKFDRFLVESYVEDNKMVKWCPSTPHCGNAIRKLEDDGKDVECSCGIQFCFNCLCESHSPCSCLIWKLWRKKCEDESDTVNWITVNTKLCPKCSKPVQKSEGCNLMTCVCRQHFCWLCGQATGSDHNWERIAGHSCGRYSDDKVRLKERAIRDLDRYTHYHYRYKSHTDSLKLEGKLRESILKKAESNSNTKDQYVFKEYSWITDGVNRLFVSRRILSYSYPFAFYMFGDELFKDVMSEEDREIKKNLFEDQQQQLEGMVEKLSKILEEPFDEYGCDEAEEMKNQVSNLSRLVNNLCKEMYKCIENDLLGTSHELHSIAPYRSEGIEQATEFLS